MITITPTEERTRLRVNRTRESRGVMTRWLERSAQRQGRHINEPSVELHFDRDPSMQQTFLYAYADSFPDTLPDWLRTVKKGSPEHWLSDASCGCP